VAGRLSGTVPHTLYPRKVRPVFRRHTVTSRRGARANYLDCPAEGARTKTRVSSAWLRFVTGPLPIFRQQTAAVVGGGDSAGRRSHLLANLKGAKQGLNLIGPTRRDAGQQGEWQDRGVEPPENEMSGTQCDLMKSSGDGKISPSLRLKSTLELTHCSELRRRGNVRRIGAQYSPEHHVPRRCRGNERGRIPSSGPSRSGANTNGRGVFARR